MIITGNKTEGQKILAKMRSEGHVWLTVPDVGYRVKFIIADKEKETLVPNEQYMTYPLTQPFALVLVNQRLHAMWLHCYPSPWPFWPDSIAGTVIARKSGHQSGHRGPGHFSDYFRHAYVKDKHVFAWAVEAHKRNSAIM